jgi:hypothetical protein
MQNAECPNSVRRTIVHSPLSILHSFGRT